MNFKKIDLFFLIKMDTDMTFTYEDKIKYYRLKNSIKTYEYYTVVYNNTINAIRNCEKCRHVEYCDHNTVLTYDNYVNTEPIPPKKEFHYSSPVHRQYYGKDDLNEWINPNPVKPKKKFSYFNKNF